MEVGEGLVRQTGPEEKDEAVELGERGRDLELQVVGGLQQIPNLGHGDGLIVGGRKRTFARAARASKRAG